SLTVFKSNFWSSFCSLRNSVSHSPKELKAFVIRETCPLSVLKKPLLQKQSISKTTQDAYDTSVYQIIF
ncbi:MAG: hypothetical protein WB445_11525, partial [Acinetobacter sp.]